MRNVRVVAVYKFCSLEKSQLEALRNKSFKIAQELNLKGTLLLAEEGLNGTLAGSDASVSAWICYLEKLVAPKVLEWKDSWSDKNPFLRLKIKIKKEIVSLGVPGVDAECNTGRKVGAKEWNALIKKPEVLVVDTRNIYETGIGSFPGAVDPQTTNFRQFPEFVESKLKESKCKTVAMFCTGGIRCEKASAYMKQQGYEDVVQLEGGILNYLETVDTSDNAWEGECFVFDERVSVDQNLAPSKRQQCYGCRWPLSEQDVNSPLYQEGVSCSRCHAQTSGLQKARFHERQKQIQLAKKRGAKHLGENARVS